MRALGGGLAMLGCKVCFASEVAARAIVKQERRLTSPRDLIFYSALTTAGKGRGQLNYAVLLIIRFFISGESLVC